jgi:glycosyltransferase involved in cell wall biosynthesis
MRVFQLIKSLGRGGAESLLLANLRAANREEFSHQFGYFLPWKNALVPFLEAEGSSVECFGAKNNASILLSARTVAEHLRRCRADVLHCHLPIAGVVGRLAGRDAGIPVVYTEHNRMERYHPLTRKLNVSTWRLQQRVVAVSADVAESVRNHVNGHVPVEVVQNGVDVESFAREHVETTGLREQLGIPPGCPVVGTVAVFRTQKRLTDWLEAAKLIRESAHPDARFLLVGDGPLRAELESHAVSLGLSDAVHWAGLQNDVRPYLALMDVYLMSSAVEGLPVALLEAMSMRCAVVATAVGGIPEVIREQHNGLLVASGRPDLLARATSDLLSSPARLREIGEQARSTVVRDFSIGRMTRQLESIYLDVVSAYRARG